LTFGARVGMNTDKHMRSTLPGQGRGLAESIHKIYGQKTGIKNQGLWRSNLAVCRPPHMPSILIEQGFLILPEYEELFLSSRHQKITADSVAQGVWEFVQKNIQ
jgi:N-acetylmuramoyl-L-alanine amidase